MAPEHELALQVPAMSCGHCEAAVTREVLRVAAAVVAAIDEAGYDAVTA